MLLRMGDFFSSILSLFLKNLVALQFGLFLLYAGLSILFEKKKNRKKETP